MPNLSAVVTGESAGEPDASSHRRSGRPHWWAVLAVTLALMALVIANSDRSRRSSTDSERPLVPSFAVRPTLPGHGSSTQSPASAPETIGRASTGGNPATHAQPGETQAPNAGAVTAPTTSATLTITPSTVPSQVVTTSPSATGSLESYPGYLEAPDDISSSYPVSNPGGTVVATANWSGSTYLSLSIDCPSAHQESSGTSGLSISTSSYDSSCNITLQEPTNISGTVVYTLTISKQSS